MKKELFADLVSSVEEAGKIRRRRVSPSREFVFSSSDVKRIRRTLGATQEEFASMIGISVSTVQNWEQGRRVPEGPSKALLKIVEKAPKTVMSALRMP